MLRVTHVRMCVLLLPLTRPSTGVLMLALLNASTPLLHLSKTAHRTGHRWVAK